MYVSITDISTAELHENIHFGLQLMYLAMSIPSVVQMCPGEDCYTHWYVYMAL